MRRLPLAAAIVVAGLCGPGVAQARLVTFHTPTNNIGCAVDSSMGARCDIRSHSWKAPRKPRSCKLDYGQALSVGKRGRGAFVCAGDTTLGIGRRVGYGRTITAGRFSCRVASSGVKCTNRSSHHGFTLAKAAYALR